MGTALDREANLFNSARDLPPGADREAFLNRECGEDSALLERIRKMLSTYDNDPSYLSTLLGAGFELNEDATLAEKPGDRIGPYVLLSVLGEGGMGIVFQAEQTHPIRRPVALKVIKPGMDSRQIVARFEAERQALAVMDHVNIARVFDAGMTSTGRPYFVMELILGTAISTFCDDRCLTNTSRIQLFQSVCDAVHHANQKGIIHRDLKPSNILVTESGGKPLVKVIDFGVAKALDNADDPGSFYTVSGQLLGTLEYMSPEQADVSEAPIDTRSDVYSLGVVLYELLTGSTPFSRESFSQLSMTELRRIIQEAEPPQPSRRMSTFDANRLTTLAERRRGTSRLLAAELKGELDWIVMKALEKEPARRYATPSAFSADLDRHLRGEAVSAGPPSRTYKWRKSMRRHRSLVIPIAIAVTGVTFAIVALQKSSSLTSDVAGRDQAALAAAEARVTQIESLLKGLTYPARPEDSAAVKALTPTYAAARSPGMSLATDDTIPPSLTRRAIHVLEILGALANDLDDHNAARTFLKRALELDDILRKQSSTTEFNEQDADSRLKLGRLFLNGPLSAEELDDATALLTAAEATYSHLSAIHPEEERYRNNSFDALVSTLALQRRKYRLSSTIRLVLAKLESQRESVSRSPGQLLVLAEYYDANRYDEASDRFNEALQAVGSFAPKDREDRFLKAKWYDTLGSVLKRTDQVAADEALTEAFALASPLVRDYPTITRYQDALRHVLEQHVSLLTACGRHDDAIQLCQRAVHFVPTASILHVLRARSLSIGVPADIAIRRLSVAANEFPTVPHYLSERAAAYESLGELNAALSDITAAVEIAPDERRHTLVMRARLFVRKGETGRALQDYMTVCDLENTPINRAMRLKARMLSGDHSLAAAELRQLGASPGLDVDEFAACVTPTFISKHGAGEMQLAYKTIINSAKPAWLNTRGTLVADMHFENGDSMLAIGALPTHFIDHYEGGADLRRFILAHDSNGRSDSRHVCMAMLPDHGFFNATVRLPEQYLWAFACIPESLPSYDRLMRVARSWMAEWQTSPAYLEAYAALLFRCSDYSEAARQFSKARSVQSCMTLSPCGYSVLAMTLARLGRNAEARDALREASNGASNEDPLFPVPRHTKLQLAMLLAEAKQVVAEPSWRPVYEDAPAGTEFWFPEAFAAAIAGDHEGYKKVCAAVVAQFHTSHVPGEDNVICWLLSLMPEAIPDYDPFIAMARTEAVAVNPKRRRPQRAGAFLYRVGLLDEARTSLERALAIPGVAALGAYEHYYLSMVFSKKGDRQKAIEHFKSANEIAERESATGDWRRKQMLLLLFTEASALLK